MGWSLSSWRTRTRRERTENQSAEPRRTGREQAVREQVVRGEAVREEVVREQAALSFARTCQELTAQLVARTSSPMWFASRVADQAYTLLGGSSRWIPVPVGLQLHLRQVTCQAMLAGEGPPLALDLAAVPAYRDREAVHRFGLGTYTGVPLRAADGSVLGTLCGTGPDPLGVHAYADLAPARQVAQHLAQVLQGDLHRLRGQRAAHVQAAGRWRDELTGLLDRRGWALVLKGEEERARAYAEPVRISVIDLGPVTSARLLRRIGAAAAEAAGGAVGGAGGEGGGEQVVLARLGGRQLGVLCAGRGERQAGEVLERVQLAVRAAGCARLVAGHALRSASTGVAGTWQQAENELIAARRASA
ncbi:nucleotidyl cyclase domain-containing protein [Kineococcus sp. SYSU DK005]|uniref:hypothetical protein n=1 Tax=Kineococcus sp. SYSU DK005 TaxID=3383126 RepID=UPI003D7C3CE4